MQILLLDKKMYVNSIKTTKSGLVVRDLDNNLYKIINLNFIITDVPKKKNAHQSTKQ